jgi:hypothetical protein
MDELVAENMSGFVFKGGCWYKPLRISDTD